MLQGVESVWETDELAALLTAASRLTGVAEGADPESDVSLRILADHARSTSMLVSDGVFPSNEARGYVLRRILRRAVRHAYILGVEQTIMAGMVDAVVEVMGPDYPDLVRNHQFVRGVIDREEVRFRETLRTGQAILDGELAELAEGSPLPGDTAFLLHDTYGFPLEVTQEITAERGVEVDVAGFETAMAEQRRRAKEARKVANGGDPAAFVELIDQFGPTDFTGRVEDTSEGRVLFHDNGLLVLDHTPFYADSGGQIGDTGTITTPTGEVSVTDTRWIVPGLTAHFVELVSGAIEVGQVATASIDSERRAAIRRNHTATHILHWALRTVLGEHVKQQGSWVGPDRLRFDFSHYDALTDEEIRQVEDLVNHEVLDNEVCHNFETTMAEAEKLGAIAFFGDKYGDIVRVLEAGRHSVELCGGTHVSSLGDIGAFKIVSEGSTGSNIRRVEAVTGTATVDLLRRESETISEAAALLGVSTDEIVVGIERRLADQKAMRAELGALKQQLAVGQAPALAADAIEGVVVAQVHDIDRDGLRDLAVSVRDQPGVRAVVLGAGFDQGGAGLVAAVQPDSGLKAGALIDEAKKTIGGGGRSSDDLAVAGGKDASAIGAALDQARSAAGIG